MLESLGRFSFRHRFFVIFIWMLLLGGLIYLSTQEGGKFFNDFNLPGTESQRTFDLLEEHFPAQSGDTGQIVFKADEGVLAVQDRMEAAFAAAKATSSHVLSITSPYDPAGAQQVAQQGDDAGKIAFAELQFDAPFNKLPEDLSDELEEAVTKAARPDDNLQVEFGGIAFQEIAPQGGREERIGLSIAVLILLLAFGSLGAMFLSVGTALFSLGITYAGIALLANVMNVATFAPLVAAMIGLGVGIDYALFIVTRYRQGLKKGKSPEGAAAIAISTAGRAVLFAGCTVIVSLMGIFLMDLDFMNGLAVGAGIAVLVTMVASITLLPALFGLVRSKIDALSIYPRRKGKPAKTVESTLGYRWSRMVQRHPVLFMLLSLIVLLVIAIPATQIRLGNSDAGNGPTSLTTRRAYDLLSEAFGPGYNGPLLVAANFKVPESFQQLPILRTRLMMEPSVAFVSPVVPNDPVKPTAAVMQVFGKFSPQDEKTDEMVKHLRKDVISPFAERTGIVVHAGGLASIGVDLTGKLTERLPYFFGGVILLSFLLLMAAFRSVLVPLKAAIMNIIAIAAAFGVLVAVFQWGWGAEFIGVDRTGPIAAFSPMLLFAILFGLSMDYEVFLLSRIKEEHEKTHNNTQAVADGLAQTARVITAAAAIMVAVFLAFVAGEDLNGKLVGLGLAVSVFLDATLVRMVLVPATMELLGEANWWLPRWLDRILPKIKIESDDEEQRPSVPSPVPVPAGAPAGYRAGYPQSSAAYLSEPEHEEIPFETGVAGGPPPYRTITPTPTSKGQSFPSFRDGPAPPPAPTVASPPPVVNPIWPPPAPVPLPAAPPSAAAVPPVAPRPPAAPPPVVRSVAPTNPALQRVTAPPPERRSAPGTGPTPSPGGPSLPKRPLHESVVPVRAGGNGRNGSDLSALLWELPYKAGKATVQQNLEELLRAAFAYHQAQSPEDLDVSRISGYLELEQRFGRIRPSSDTDHAAQLLVGALAAPGRTDREHSEFAAAAVRIVLEGIKP